MITLQDLLLRIEMCRSRGETVLSSVS